MVRIAALLLLETAALGTAAASAYCWAYVWAATRPGLGIGRLYSVFAAAFVIVFLLFQPVMLWIACRPDSSLIGVGRAAGDSRDIDNSHSS